ncbi:MAG: FadR family transcriptional regulator [Burkholderiales bacterium]|nr:FadR family transcriptional regulator [Burkholderiales bacterium]
MQRSTQEIGSRIVRGVYPPGTVLPFEEDIGRELGVGRNIVREAIKALVAKGMLVTARRAGTTVLPKARWNLLDPEVLQWAVASERNRAELIAELTQLRRILEPEVAALAAANAGRADALRLFEAYESMERDNQDPLCAIAADIQFHERLFEATHNQLIQSLVKSFVVLLRSIFELSIRSEGGFIRNLGEHLTVAEAVSRGDAEGARNAMRLLLGKNEADLVSAKALPAPPRPQQP